MKLVTLVLVVLLSVGAVLAQSGTSPQTAPAQNQSAAQGKPAQPTSQPTSQAASQPAATAQAAPASKRLQAKTKAEFDAYTAGAALTDPNQVMVAADQFAQKFPTSELRELLYVRAMNMFQQQNDAEKEIAAGRKAIAMDPTDPIPRIHVASTLVEITHDNDLDKDERYAEAMKDAQAAIDNINIGLQIPPNVTEQQVKAVKDNIVATAYESIGVVQMNKLDFAAAETSFQKAVDISKDEPMARIYLRLSVAQDNEKKYNEALVNANKAMQYSQDGTVEKALAKQQQARLEKLVGEGSNPSLPGPGAVPPPAPAPGNPATIPGNNAPPQPH